VCMNKGPNWSSCPLISGERGNNWEADRENWEEAKRRTSGRGDATIRGLGKIKTRSIGHTFSFF